MSYRPIELPANEIVFRQGDPGKFMYLVREGELEVLQDFGSHQKQIAVLERGDFFGEMAVLDNVPRSHSVRTLAPSKLIEIDRAGFQHMLRRNADIAVRMIRKLSNRLTGAEDMLLRAYTGRAAFEAGMEAEPPSPEQARLLLLSDRSELPLPDLDEIRIGRVDPASGIYPEIDLTRVDVQLTTSRRHARLLRRGGSFFLQEEKATNGTYVNSQRISATRPLEIRSGDEIMFGAVATRFLVD